MIFPDLFMVRIIFGGFPLQKCAKSSLFDVPPVSVGNCGSAYQKNALETFDKCRDDDVSLKTQTIGNNVLNAHRHL